MSNIISTGFIVTLFIFTSCGNSEPTPVVNPANPTQATNPTSPSKPASRFDVWRGGLTKLTGLPVEDTLKFVLTEVPRTSGTIEQEEIDWVTNQFSTSKFIKITANGPRGTTLWYSETKYKSGFYWVITQTNSNVADIDCVPGLARDGNGVYGFDGNPNGGAHFRAK